MRLWKITLGAAVVLGAAGIAGIHALGVYAGGTSAGAATPAPAMAAMPVPVTPVVKMNVPIYLDYSGRTEAIRNVTLQARVAGYLEQQDAPDGADVQAGDLLYRIDARDFRAALDQTKAQTQRDAASLDYARANLSRGDELAKSGWVSKDVFDQRTSSARQAEAALAADRAASRTAELNLSYAEIRAPFAGRLGRTLAVPGTLISIAGAGLNTLVQLDPIYVTFNPSETDLAALQKARAAGPVEADILVPGETRAHHKGELSFIDNVVDRATGTITARASIANADRTLLPGQYVRVRLHVENQPDALMVPQAALGASQIGQYVYVVGADNKADQRFVTLGPQSGGLVALAKGVAEGDRVITGNLQKIGPGAPVQPLPPTSAAGS